jgi:hypothetical protein
MTNPGRFETVLDLIKAEQERQIRERKPEAEIERLTQVWVKGSRDEREEE